MSKDLAQQQTECEVFIPLEFTEEIKPETFGLEITEATQLLGGIDIISAELEVLKNTYIDVIGLEITSENLPIFKELRLKLVKNRTSRDKWRKAKKAYFLNGGRFVDAIAKKYDVDNEEMESKLLEGEKYFENLEKEAKRILNEKRIEIIRPFVEDVAGLDFSDFSDEDFDDYVLGKKTRFEANLESIRLANIEAEKERQVLILHNERIAILLPYWNFILEADKDRNWGAFDKETFESCLKMYQDRKNVFDAENEKIRIENARLKKEADDAKAKADQLESENNAKLEAQEKENARIAKELQDKKDVDTKAENERLANIEADKKAAELASKAPIKKQMELWIETFSYGLQPVDNEVSKEIIEKFEAFKSWAKKETENL